MNGKENMKINLKIEDAVKIFYPPILYIMITMCIEVITGIVLIIKRIGSINVDVSSLIASYDFIDEFTKDIDKYSNVIVFLSAVIGIVVFGYIYYKDSEVEKKITVSKQLSYEKAKEILILIIFGFFISKGLSDFVSLLQIDNIVGDYDEISNSLLQGELFFQIISVGIVVPIVEELIYRGLVYDRIRKNINVRYAIVVTSLLFGIFHFNLLQGLYAFLLSLFLAYSVYFYSSLLPAIIIHSVANISAIILNYYTFLSTLKNNKWINVLFMICEIIIALIIFIIYMTGDNSKNDEKSYKTRG